MSDNSSQAAGIYRRRIGDALVTVVNDGYLDVPVSILHGAEPDEIQAALEQSFAPATPRIAVNAFVVEIGGRRILVDAGGGATTVASMGRLIGNLGHAGYRTRDFGTVLLTHIHPDHSSGLLDADLKPLFPEAEIVVHKDELKFWTSADVRDGIIPAAKPYIGSARALSQAYGDQFRAMDGGEVVPGLTQLPLPGHTPGHSGYVLNSAGESLLIWGDTVHIPELQIPIPGVTSEFDISEDMAAESRRKLFRHVADEKLLVTGGHLHLPGFAHLLRNGDDYRLVPEVCKVTF